MSALASSFASPARIGPARRLCMAIKASATLRAFADVLSSRPHIPELDNDAVTLYSEERQHELVVRLRLRDKAGGRASLTVRFQSGSDISLIALAPNGQLTECQAGGVFSLLRLPAHDLAVASRLIESLERLYWLARTRECLRQP